MEREPLARRRRARTCRNGTGTRNKRLTKRVGRAAPQPCATSRAGVSRRRRPRVPATRRRAAPHRQLLAVTMYIPVTARLALPTCR